MDYLEMRNPSFSPNQAAAEMKPRQRYVVLSVGTDAKYSYWLPAVVLAWKIRQKFTPIIFLVEDDANTGWYSHNHTRLILNLLAEYDIQHVYFLSPDPSLSDNAIKLTQLSRLYASTLPFLNDHDFLITTDVDLLPVAMGEGQYYDSFDRNLASEAFTPFDWQRNQPILLFDLEEFQQFDDKWGYHFKEWPLSNIGMSVLRWRQIIRLPSPSVLPEPFSVEQLIVERINEDVRLILHSTGDEWYWDQQLMSLRLETAIRTENIVWERDVVVKRRTNRNRINRIEWPLSLTSSEIDTKFDSHLPRVPDTRATYRDIFDMSKWLLQYVVNGDLEGIQHLNRLERFTADFQTSIR